MGESEFEYELQQAQRMVESYMEGEDIVTFLDDCGAPILHIIDGSNEESQFLFTLSGNKYLVGGGVARCLTKIA